MAAAVANFNDDINIKVNLAAPALDRADFQTPLIVSDSMAAGFDDPYREYRSLSDSNSDDHLSAELKAMLGAAFGQRSAPRKVLVGKVDTDLPTTFDALAEATSWYHLLLESGTQADLLAAAAWAEPNKRLFFGQSTEADILDGGVDTDIASKLKAFGYQQSATIYSSAADVWRAVAYVANRASFDPGERLGPWNKIGLVGFGPEEAITPAQKAAALVKNANLYLSFRGQAAMGDGKVASGHDISLIVAANWIQARMEEELAATIYNRHQANLAIEYTNDGITVLLDAAKRVLSRAQAARMIKTGWKVVAPNVDDLSDAVVEAGELAFSWLAEPLKSVSKVSGSGLLFRGSVDLEL